MSLMYEVGARLYCCAAARDLGLSSAQNFVCVYILKRKCTPKLCLFYNEVLCRMMTLKRASYWSVLPYSVSRIKGAFDFLPFKPVVLDEVMLRFFPIQQPDFYFQEHLYIVAPVYGSVLTFWLVHKQPSWSPVLMTFVWSMHVSTSICIPQCLGRFSRQNDEGSNPWGSEIYALVRKFVDVFWELRSRHILSLPWSMTCHFYFGVHALETRRCFLIYCAVCEETIWFHQMLKLLRLRRIMKISCGFNVRYL